MGDCGSLQNPLPRPLSHEWERGDKHNSDAHKKAPHLAGLFIKQGSAG